jgi:RNA polymerase-binding transcription factor DksA
MEIAMSRSKGEPEEAEEDWHSIAHSKGYRCDSCGSIIPYDEREVYFATGLCDWCRHRLEKND